MGKLNPKLPSLLEEHKISVIEGTLALIGLNHGIDVSKVIDQDVLYKLMLKGFIERVYPSSTKSHMIKINVPIYENQEVEWQWVEEEFMKLFRNTKPSVQMSYDECKKRMIRFFQDNPAVRKDDVIKAAKLYLSEVDDVKYLQAPHYFIRKGQGVDHTSRLQTYLDKLKKGSSVLRHKVR